MNATFDASIPETRIQNLFSKLSVVMGVGDEDIVDDVGAGSGLDLEGADDDQEEDEEDSHDNEDMGDIVTEELHDIAVDAKSAKVALNGLIVVQSLSIQFQN